MRNYNRYPGRYSSTFASIGGVLGKIFMFLLGFFGVLALRMLFGF